MQKRVCWNSHHHLMSTRSNISGTLCGYEVRDVTSKLDYLLYCWLWNLTTPSFMWGSGPCHSNLCQLFCRAAGREHYEAGRTAEALECLKAAAQKDESAITLTNLGMYLTTGIKITTHFCCSKPHPNGQLLYLLANKWITSMAGVYTSDNWPICSSQLWYTVYM